MRVTQLSFVACAMALEAAAGADLVIGGQLDSSTVARDFQASPWRSTIGGRDGFDADVDSIASAFTPCRSPQDSRAIDQSFDIKAIAAIPQCAHTKGSADSNQDLAPCLPSPAYGPSPNPIPSPSTAAMVGMVGLLAVRRKR